MGRVFTQPFPPENWMNEFYFVLSKHKNIFMSGRQCGDAVRNEIQTSWVDGWLENRFGMLKHCVC